MALAMVLAIIQARYSSTRFPGKALADLSGKPVIQHVIERAKKIHGVDDVAVAVPAEEMDELSWISWRWTTYAVQVPISDVLGRFASVAAARPEAEAIVRITSDCPLLQQDVCSLLIAGWRASGCEYGWLDTHTGIWPDGLDCEVFTRDLLMQAHMQATEAYDREHVTSIMRRMRTPFSLPADSAYNDWPKVSIDTPEDLERVREFSRRTVVA
jgi:spore coat polysaccharide biosynthesis protein SpsF (cytidylyltransferase family)